MDKMLYWLIPLAIIVLIVLWAIGIYNRLVALREMVHNSMGQIAAQIESRWDALKSLIDATKNYQAHEADTLKSITESRTRVSPGSTVRDVAKDEKLFQSALTQIYAVAENYPDLKASSVYQTTMDSINRYEDNVRHSRMLYNDTVTKLNRTLQQFPTNIVAGMFGFRTMEYFQNSTEKAEMPQW